MPLGCYTEFVRAVVCRAGTIGMHSGVCSVILAAAEIVKKEMVLLFLG